MESVAGTNLTVAGVQTLKKRFTTHLYRARNSLPCSIRVKKKNNWKVLRGPPHSRTDDDICLFLFDHTRTVFTVIIREKGIHAVTLVFVKMDILTLKLFLVHMSQMFRAK